MITLIHQKHLERSIEHLCDLLEVKRRGSQLYKP